ncbi:MAG: hydroxyacid dehydrogenase [Bacteroidales bacterium]|nr:hydroxyacid dehydrogenase [Bacteroidales bacterium]
MLEIVYLDASSMGNASLEPIRALGHLVTWPLSTPSEALVRVRDADVLIVNKVRVTDELMAAAPRLKLVCEAATGVNNIDLEAAARRGIPVRNVAGYSTEAVVQLTFAQLLALLCGTAYFDAEVKDGTYSAGSLFTDISRPFPELSGKTLGIIGMGTIGKRVAAIAGAFGMRVVYYSTSGTSHCRDYPSLPLADLLAQADVVSIHAPLNGNTAGLLGPAQLRRMKPGAVLLNMARGGIVDEAALARALDEGWIAGAAVDVFTTEPLPAGHPFLHLAHPERLLLSPHVAWASREALARLVQGIATNIEQYFRNETNIR